MRIGLVVYGSLDVVSGGNLYDAKLVERLRGSGHRVEILSIPRRGYLFDLLSNLSPSLRRRIASGGYDLLLEDELTHPSLLWLNRGVRAGLRPSGYGQARRSSAEAAGCGVPLVSIVHHLRSNEERPEWQNDIYRRFELRYLRSVDAFVFNSETTRETVEALLARKTRCIVATPGGDRLRRPMPRERVETRAREGGELRILFVGNLIPRKGLHVLLDALASLGERSFRLDVVGSAEMDRAYAARIQRQVARLGLEGRVRFHGTLAGEGLTRRFLDAQILAVPSSYEGFGIVYLEAMGFGLPVIASASGATDEIVRHESTGFLVPPGDGWSLARRIESFIEDRELLSRLSLAAYGAFDDHPGWADSMGRIEAFLVDLARSGS